MEEKSAEELQVSLILSEDVNAQGLMHNKNCLTKTRVQRRDLPRAPESVWCTRLRIGKLICIFKDSKRHRPNHLQCTVRRRIFRKTL